MGVQMTTSLFAEAEAVGQASAAMPVADEYRMKSRRVHPRRPMEGPPVKCKGIARVSEMGSDGSAEVVDSRVSHRVSGSPVPAPAVPADGRLRPETSEMIAAIPSHEILIDLGAEAGSGR